VDVIWRWLYGPNVLAAVVGASGILAVFFALFIAAPAGSVRRVTGRSGGGLDGLARRLAQANLPVTPEEFLRVGGMIALAGGIVGYLLTRTRSGFLLGGVAGPFLYWGHLEARRDKTRRAYQAALARVAAIVRDVVAGGEDLVTAMTAVAERGPRVVRGDFREAVSAMNTGVPLEQALDRMRRVRRDPVLDVLVDVLVVHYQHGGRMQAVLARLASAVRRRTEVMRRVQSEQSRTLWEARIVSVAPFIALAVFRFTAPELVIPFYSTVAGEMLILAVGAMSAFSYWLVTTMGTRPLRVLESATEEDLPEARQ